MFLSVVTFLFRTLNCHQLFQNKAKQRVGGRLIGVKIIGEPSCIGMAGPGRGRLIEVVA